MATWLASRTCSHETVASRLYDANYQDGGALEGASLSRIGRAADASSQCLGDNLPSGVTPLRGSENLVQVPGEPE